MLRRILTSLNSLEPHAQGAVRCTSCILRKQGADSHEDLGGESKEIGWEVQ